MTSSTRRAPADHDTEFASKEQRQRYPGANLAIGGALAGIQGSSACR